MEMISLSGAGAPGAGWDPGYPDPAAREAAEHLREVAEGVEEVLWMVECQGWRVLYASPACERVWGWSRATLYDDPGSLLGAVHEEDRPGSAEEFFLGAPEREYRIVRPDGEVRWIRSRLFPVRDPAGRAHRVAGISEDVTRRRLSEAQLLHGALHDSLTGLPNRAAFRARLRKAMDRLHQQPQTAFTVLFVDVDHFKRINDSLGHLHGDELLVSLSRRLEECVRPEDMVARLGGDEFVVLLHNTPRVADAARVAQRIQDVLREPFDLGDKEVLAGASIGIVPSAGYDSAEELLRDADQAMYRVKAAGVGGYQVFDDDMHAAAVARLHLEAELRTALQRDEFRLHYLPIVALDTGRIAGVEALVRWERPGRGLALPQEFMRVAEETGVIVPLGWWALREACRQMGEWRRERPEFRELSLSVNLAGRQFARRETAERVAEILRETGIPARLLQLEVTETMLVDHAEAAESFAALRELGVRLHLDDFGTGCSSLSALQRFPVDMLKVDRTFVGGAGEGGEMLRAVAALGRSLRMEVIAEGVETAEQLARVRAVGCEYAQGHLFSRPLDAARTEALVRALPRW